jgi:hypothetical protein
MRNNIRRRVAGDGGDRKFSSENIACGDSQTTPPFFEI